MAESERELPLDVPLAFPTLSFHDVEDCHLILAPEVPAWARLDDQEWNLFLALLSSPTLGHVVKDYGSDSVGVLLSRLMSAGFFHASNAPVYRTHLQFHLTNRCNLRCRHCYLDSGITHMDEMTLSEWQALVDTAVEISSTNRIFVSLSGGEPLLQDFTPDLIAHARQRGIPEIAMISNGLLLDEPMVRRLETAGLTNLAISLDGATASVNDRVRGRGVFENVMVALRVLEGSAI